MLRRIWVTLLLMLSLTTAWAQSLSGVWQGVETNAGEQEGYWPCVLRVQQNKAGELFGVLYQEVGGQPEVSITFQVKAQRTKAGMLLQHGRPLLETGRNPFNYWCDGAITFTYDAAQEKLVGKATYRPVGTCTVGTLTLYRIRLKSEERVPAGVATTLRVSGKDVQWYADAERTRLVARGNTFRTTLRKATTYYLTQGYYPSRQSDAVPITIQVGPAPKSVAALPPSPPPVPKLRLPTIPTPVEPPIYPPVIDPPIAAGPDTVAAPPPAPPVLSARPLVLPTVLFKTGTPELLPTAEPALAQLAAELQARPQLRIRVIGHTDRIGEPQKNLVLSEQRAAAVKAYLEKAGVAPERVSTEGLGDARPLYPSPDARNRRVEVQVVE